MNKNLTLGSLFSGSGGFELAAIFCGIKPIWASEVEPFPIRVTQKNLPQVKHLGDIKEIDGVIATIMALDRAIRNGNVNEESVYDNRGLLFM